MQKIFKLILQKIISKDSSGLAASRNHRIQQQNCFNYRSMAFNQKHFEELRKWVDIKTNHQKTSDDLEFKVMSYNILAQDLLQMHPYLYHHHDRQALQWQNRYKLILREILEERPDILCLQEGNFN